MQALLKSKRDCFRFPLRFVSIVFVPASPEFRFQEFRERAGLSREEVARQAGLSTPCIWDIEGCEDEISTCYSVNEVRQFCRILSITPRDLFAFETNELPIAPADLVRQIREQCERRGMMLEQFGDLVGWDLEPFITSPGRILEEMSIDGLQALCRELGVAWPRMFP